MLVGIMLYLAGLYVDSKGDIEIGDKLAVRGIPMPVLLVVFGIILLFL